MSNNLITLLLFELKKIFCNHYKWFSNAMFLMVNMTIFPFTITPNLANLSALFLPVIITSVLLGVILTTNNIFDEDVADGTFDQLLTFNISLKQIFLSKIIASSIEFCLITFISLSISSVFYNIAFTLIIKIWFIISTSIPILTSISIFGALLTINLSKNAALSVLLICPLLISVLILIGLSASKVLESKNLHDSVDYIEINIGVSMLFIPILSWLVKFLR